MEKIIVNGIESRTVLRHPLDSEDSSPDSVLEVHSALEGPSENLTEVISPDFSDPEDDKSLYQAVLSPDNQDCRLQKGNGRKRLIIPRRIPPEEVSDFEDTLSQGDSRFDSDDEIETSILEQLDNVEPISEYTAEEEREDIRSWRSVDLGGTERRIDMKVIEPYKRVLSHGGYLNAGSRNAIIVISACFLPDRSRADYNYVMDNLSSYILVTLDELVTDDYLLVYLHGGAPKNCIPTFAWIKKCYKIIDRRLRKQLKQLYLVHPTIMLRALATMSRLFVSSKFYNKIQFINSLADLYEILPLEQASIPERVCQYDRIKLSIQKSEAV